MRAIITKLVRIMGQLLSRTARATLCRRNSKYSITTLREKTLEVIGKCWKKYLPQPQEKNYMCWLSITRGLYMM